MFPRRNQVVSYLTSVFFFSFLKNVFIIEGCAQLLQSCLTLCELSTVAHQVPLSMGILQARILE